MQLKKNVSWVMGVVVGVVVVGFCFVVLLATLPKPSAPEAKFEQGEPSSSCWESRPSAAQSRPMVAAERQIEHAEAKPIVAMPPSDSSASATPQLSDLCSVGSTYQRRPEPHSVQHHGCPLMLVCSAVSVS